MAAGLTLEQMEFLASKGMSIADAIEFAKLGSAKSKGAERTARWRARKQGNVTSDVTRDASPPPIEDHTPPVSSDEETSDLSPKPDCIAKPEKPDDVTPQTWRDFTAHRVKLKAPVTETAIVGMRREAAKAGWSLEAALAESVTQGWRGFKADWVAEQKSTGPPGNVSYLDTIVAKQARTPA